MAVLVSRPRVVVLVRPGRQSTIFRGTLAPPPGDGGGVTDHGALTGLADDDHTQYALADGSRGAFEVAGAVSTHAALTQVHGISAFGATLVNDTTAAAARETLGAMALIPGDNENMLLKADDSGQPILSNVSEQVFSLIGGGQADSAWTAGTSGTRTAVSPAQVRVGVLGLVGTTAGTVAAGDAAPNAHTHPLSELEQSGASSGQVAAWNGSAWAPAAPSVGGGSPGGASGNLQTNDGAGGFGAVAGTSWAANQLLVTAPDAAVTPLAIRAAASQTAAQQQWQNSAGTRLTEVNAGGRVLAPLWASGAFAPGHAFAGADTTGLLGFSTSVYLVSNGALMLQATAGSGIRVRAQEPVTFNNSISSTERARINANADGDFEITPVRHVRFGTHSALAAETVTGYITIRDAAGTERKLAVVS